MPYGNLFVGGRGSVEVFDVNQRSIIQASASFDDLGASSQQPPLLPSGHKGKRYSKLTGMIGADIGYDAPARAGYVAEDYITPAIKRDSKNTDNWSVSAYQRDTPLTPQRGDTIFRGSVADSPVATLELTIDGIQTRFPAQPGGQEMPVSSPFSQADSDPFSDYRSYESDQVEMENMTDEDPKRLAPKTKQPRLQYTTTFSQTPVKQQKQAGAFKMTDQSPLDTLCRSLRTPADLPESPSPFSVRRMHAYSMQPDNSPFRDPSASDTRPAELSDNWFAKRPSFSRASAAQPMPTPMVGAATPNFSLPAANQLSISAATQQSSNRGSNKRGSFSQWYHSYAPMISCISSTGVAICLAVCSLSTKSGPSLLATVPAKAFVGLEGVADYVELHPSTVCLLRNGVSSPT